MRAIAAATCRQTRVIALPECRLQRTESKEQRQNDREGTPHLP